MQGFCFDGNMTICPSPDACHVSFCDEATGACELLDACPPQTCRVAQCVDGACHYTCSDNNLCTVNDVRDASGTCVGTNLTVGAPCGGVPSNPCWAATCQSGDFGLESQLFCNFTDLVTCPDSGNKCAKRVQSPQWPVPVGARHLLSISLHLSCNPATGRCDVAEVTLNRPLER